MSGDSGVGRFFGGIYADLRDRRLLPVVALLLVAIVAVPFLMGKDAETAAPASLSGEAVQPAFETDPVVLASQPELRSFRKRLDGFQARNPFNQYLPKVEDEPVDGTAGAAAGAVATEPGITPIDLGTDTGIPSVDTGSEPIVPPPGDSADPIPTEPVPTEPTGGEDSGQTLISTRIDVRVGRVGELQVIKGVKFLDFLPEKKTPVVEYVQSDLALTNAVFIVSPSVLMSDGDGKCAPTPQSCQFLQLEVGQTRAFQYDDGERYTLTLLDVNIHEEPFEEGDAKAAGRSPDFSTGAPAAKVVGG